MARIRTIKPEFWQDEKLSPLPCYVRLVFLGLISMADDAGRLLDNAKVIDAFIFPNTNEGSKVALDKLESLGRIVRGETASGQPIIEIAKWQEHQRVTHPSPYTLPPLVKVSGESHEKLVPLPTTTITNTNTTVSPAEDPFDTAWTAYPRRPNNSRVAARKAWDARIREGCDPALMLDGVRRYAAYVVASGTEPQFVKMASTFFGPGKHWESDYTVSEKVDADLVALAEEARPEAYANAEAVRAWVERTRAEMASGGLSPFGTRSGLETPLAATGGASS